MTIVAAMTDGARTWLASDRRALAGPLILPPLEGKWSGLGCGWWIAAPGRQAWSDLLEAHAAGGAFKARDDLAGMVMALRGAWKEIGGADETEQSGPVHHGPSRYLLAKPGAVAMVWSNGCWSVMPPGRWASVGQGEDFFDGYLAAHMGGHGNPEKTARMAIEAASEWFTGVGDGAWTKVLEP